MSSKTLGKRKTWASAPSAKFKKPAQRKVPFIKKVKGSIKYSIPELKVVDTAIPAADFDTTGIVIPLNEIAAGDDFNNRDGRQVKIQSVELRGLIQPELSTFMVPHLARLMLVWDAAPNSAAAVATMTQILTAASATSFPNVNNSQRFTVLKDMTWAFGVINNTATQAFAVDSAVASVHWYQKLDEITIYDGTTGTIDEIQNGALLLVVIGDQAAASAVTTFTGGARVRFKD